MVDAKKFFDLTGFAPEKASVAQDILMLAMAQLRKTRPGIADMMEAEKLFLVTLYDEDYAKLPQWRASYAPYAEVQHIVELVHPTVGPALGLVMMPKPGLTIREIFEKRSGQEMPEGFGR